MGGTHAGHAAPGRMNPGGLPAEIIERLLAEPARGAAAMQQLHPGIRIVWDCYGPGDGGFSVGEGDAVDSVRFLRNGDIAGRIVPDAFRQTKKPGHCHELRRDGCQGSG